ncbi:MAG TPA: ATP-dependent RecD-like DNA helicase [Chlamydiales bacterium]|nr:ATP-dependent RecD-like DNA helicase [Chlamydiales bacterium]
MAQEKLTGIIERITFYSEESHFSVALLLAAPSKKEVVIIGTMPGIQVGVTATVSGNFQRHPKHGIQFEVDEFQLELPQNPLSIEKFLGSGSVRGVGKAYAAKIVEKFGAKSLEVIEKTPERLFEVGGLGQKRYEMIVQSWGEQKTLQEVVIFLHGYGVSLAVARRILRTYGVESLRKIRENPYKMAKEVNGVGFILADSIASHLGFQKESPHRIDSGIDYTLYLLSQEGHVTFPLNDFVIKAKELLEVDEEMIRERIRISYESEKPTIELRPVDGQMFIWSKALYACEKGIALEIARLMEGKSAIREIVSTKAIDWVQEQCHIRFADAQKEAIQQAFEEKFCIITGGPGTGKSTITKAILAVYRKLTSKIILAAPTGRAAKRMHEITHHQASTIHRILKFDFTNGGFQHNRENPLSADLLIIDESSMIDTYLMYQLLRAIPTSCRVIVIGDANQLPSIGPGNVLRDLIESKTLPTTNLTAIYRQAAGSQIIVNAHKINKGEFPFITNKRFSDFFFFEAETPEEVRKTILELITERIPKKFPYDIKRDIQLLAPMRKGPIGIELFNKDLQEALTPGQGHMRRGDKVMQLRNNYQKEVFNGDIGYVQFVDAETSAVTVDFDDNVVTYEPSELDEITLAYAVSVHKYQGSECPVIVMPIHTAHFKMLTKNLLYTAVTRGRKLVCLVGTKKALAMAVKNQEVEARFTALKMQLSCCISKKA